MNYVERLNDGLKSQLRLPWSNDKSGGERVWFLVFDPAKLRDVAVGRDMFRMSVQAAGYRWEEFDISNAFGQWMADHRYASRFYARPTLAKSAPEDFAAHLASSIKAEILERGLDERTVLALTGTESLYGISRMSHVTRMIEDAVPGRLLVFFPGDFVSADKAPYYRFLDARDGWNYLAVPIVPTEGKGNT